MKEPFMPTSHIVIRNSTLCKHVIAIGEGLCECVIKSETLCVVLQFKCEMRHEELFDPVGRNAVTCTGDLRRERESKEVRRFHHKKSRVTK